ncbi:hypothetical protein [Tenacibaculum sp. SG-28]|uniref:hypothetical protein n=1 Tax=Tenacibaculum sp. SG-28 TaxID=754426 RepID=UPI000CF4808A|nr:hypothetical protein [Tenacibaculum sp. SG-28]PQJ19718.1 hypothetical protein BSU00_12200 [Tenacibaculum sp. SG-28]
MEWYKLVLVDESALSITEVDGDVTNELGSYTDMTASGAQNKIGEYKSSSSATAVVVNETLTNITQASGNETSDVTAGDARTIGTYKSEDGTDATINETVTTLSQDTASGQITYTNESNTTQTANVVAGETDNKLTVGANGGAYFAGPTVTAAGKVTMSYNNDTFTTYASHTVAKEYNIATVTRIDEGDYEITFTNAMDDMNYIIQLTVKDCGGNCPGNSNSNYDDPGITYYDQTETGFKVNIGDSDNGTNQKDDIDLEFMFTVIDF